MNIIFTDYTKEKLEKLKKYEIISHLLFVFSTFLILTFVFYFIITTNPINTGLIILSVLLFVSALSLFVFFGSKLFKAYGAKYRYAEAIDEIGEENLKSQEYDYKLSILTITYTKNGEELNRCIRLENMLVRYKNNVDGIIINFDTNEIIKPRIIIGGPDSGKKRLSGGEEE